MQQRIAFIVLLSLAHLLFIPLMIHFGNTWAGAATLLITFISLGCIFALAPKLSADEDC